MKYHILFVDDDVRLLEGLQRMLRPMRHEWEMSFVNGGQEALAFHERTSVSVVVSDVRMPGLNGVQLLSEIKRLYPQTIRILLSGQSNEEMALTAIGAAHQYLTKPCEADFLKSTIRRACAMRELLTNTHVRTLVSQIETLPTLPELYLELEQELKSSDCCIQKVAGIIGKDVGMMGQILKLVNSAFFGIQQHITNASHAVMFLGLETLKTLVLSLQIFKTLRLPASTSFDLPRLQQHSLATGEVARKIMLAEKADEKMVEESFAAAMLHDVGLLLLASYFPDRHNESRKIAQEQTISLHEAEQQILCTTHAEVGAYLLGLWGFPTPIVEAVAFHHNPLGSPNSQFSPLTAVHVGNILASEGAGCLPEGKLESHLSMKYLEQVGVKDRIPSWQSLLEVSI